MTLLCMKLEFLVEYLLMMREVTVQTGSRTY